MKMIKRLMTSEFFSASFWVFLTTVFINGGNYLYHLLMGRLLGPEQYGVLEGTISFLYILSVPFGTLNLVIVKFISSYKGKTDERGISSFYHYFINKLLIYGSIGTLVLVLASPLIMSLLHLPSWYLPILLAASFFIGVFSVLNKGMLQGLFKFSEFFLVNLLEISSKIIMAILLVILGFKAVGAFGSLIIAGLLGYFLASSFIKQKKFSKESIIDGKKIFKYSIPVFLTTLATTSLFTSDIILVRYFFSGIDSGYYAALSVLGKIIFYAAWPITIVLFPMVSTRHAGGGKYRHLFFLSLGLTFCLASFLVFLYFLVPSFMVNLLFGTNYLKIAPLLGLFGIFIAFYSISALFSNFYLSINKNLVGILSLASAILQVILIVSFHKNLLQVIQMSIITSGLFLISLLIYYPFATKEKIKP